MRPLLAAAVQTGTFVSSCAVLQSRTVPLTFGAAQLACVATLRVS